MKKFLIVTGIVLLIIIAVLAYFRLFYTKSFSPETVAGYQADGLKISVYYNRPSKKGRLIFGEKKDNALVPWGKVWRTGANEASTFETNQDLVISEKKLPAGKYSFWTIPGGQTWTVMFNSEIPSWGVDFNAEANRNPKTDVVSVEVPVVLQDKEFEQFTISVEKAGEDLELILLWDKTLVAIPISR
jgi:hypothetical protein